MPQHSGLGGRWPLGDMIFVIIYEDKLLGPGAEDMPRSQGSRSGEREGNRSDGTRIARPSCDTCCKEEDHRGCASCLPALPQIGKRSLAGLAEAGVCGHPAQNQPHICFTTHSICSPKSWQRLIHMAGKHTYPIAVPARGSSPGGPQSQPPVQSQGRRRQIFEARSGTPQGPCLQHQHAHSSGISFVSALSYLDQASTSGTYETRCN